MRKFWTLTDSKMEAANSRSSRFNTLESTIAAANLRVEKGASEVCIMECVKVVKRAAQPTIVEDVEPPATDDPNED